MLMVSPRSRRSLTNTNPHFSYLNVNGNDMYTTGAYNKHTQINAFKFFLICFYFAVVFVEIFVFFF